MRAIFFILLLANLIFSTCQSLNSQLSTSYLTIQNGDSAQLSITVSNPLWLNVLTVEYIGSTNLNLGSIPPISSRTYTLTYPGNKKGNGPIIKEIPFTIKGTGESKCFEKEFTISISYILSDEESNIINEIKSEKTSLNEKLNLINSETEMINQKYNDAQNRGIIFTTSDKTSIENLLTKKSVINNDFSQLGSYLNNQQAYLAEGQFNMIKTKLDSYDTLLSSINSKIDSTIDKYNSAVNSINEMNSAANEMIDLINIYAQFIDDEEFKSENENLQEKIKNVNRDFMLGNYDIVLSSSSEVKLIISNMDMKYTPKLEQFFEVASQNISTTYTNLQVNAKENQLTTANLSLYDDYNIGIFSTAKLKLCEDISKLNNYSFELQRQAEVKKEKINLSVSEVQSFINDYSKYWIYDCFPIEIILFDLDQKECIRNLLNNNDSYIDCVNYTSNFTKIYQKQIAIANYFKNKFMTFEKGYKSIDCTKENYANNLSINLIFSPSLDSINEISNSCGIIIETVSINQQSFTTFDNIYTINSETQTIPLPDKTTNLPITKDRVEKVIMAFSELKNIGNGRSISLSIIDREDMRYFLIKKESDSINVYQSSANGDILLGIDYTSFEELEKSSNVCSKLKELTSYGTVYAQIINKNHLDMLSFCVIKDCVSSQEISSYLKYCF